VVAERPGRGEPGDTGGLTGPLIVLGGGPAQRHAIEAAAALGVSTVVLDVDPARGDVPISTEDVDGVRRATRDAEAGGVIAPGTDWPVRIGAYACHDLGIPHPISVETARLATNKLAQRQALRAAGVPQPAWSESAPPSFPCVVKAPDRQGQRGMSVVAYEDELRTAVSRARHGSRSGRVLFETFIAGPEVTVNGFSLEGAYTALAVTDRHHFEGAPGVARRHVYPPAQDPRPAAAAAEAAVQALGITQGPSYVQIVLGADGPRVMEVAARLGGGHDSELVRIATGVDLAAAAVRCAMGMPVDPADLVPRPSCACVIEFLQAPPGRLVEAAGPPEATFYHPSGHVYGPLHIATDRAGYVIVSAPHREEALRKAENACQAIRFEVE
jgi:biotin carboxylase